MSLLTFGGIKSLHNACLYACPTHPTVTSQLGQILAMDLFPCRFYSISPLWSANPLDTTTAQIKPILDPISEDSTTKNSKWQGWFIVSPGWLPEDKFPRRAKESVFPVICFHQIKTCPPQKSQNFCSWKTGVPVWSCPPFNVKTEALCKTWKQFKTLKKTSPTHTPKQEFPCTVETIQRPNVTSWWI